MKRISPTAVVLAFCLLAAPARAVVTFNFTFADVTNHTGSGFDDASLGQLRRDTLTNFINSTVGLSLAGSTTVDIAVNSVNTPGSFLASAGAYVALVPNSLQGGLVYSHILSGVDPSDSNPDAVLTWNWAYNYALTGMPTGAEFDFRSVALHEITHTLGFASFIGSSGASEFGSNIYSVFDSFLSNGSSLLINPTTHAFQASASDLTGNVYFTGSNAQAVYGGAVPVFTPSTWTEGSSISHWDDAAGLSSMLMSYSIAAGEVNQSWSALEIAVLQDLGYSMAVPEPASVALLFGAMSAGCWLVRRRFVWKK